MLLGALPPVANAKDDGYVLYSEDGVEMRNANSSPLMLKKLDAIIGKRVLVKTFKILAES